MKLRVTPESKLQVTDVREICDSKRSPVISLKDRLYPGKTGYIPERPVIYLCTRSLIFYIITINIPWTR